MIKEVAIYLRKSRFDDESETREEVLARHEQLLKDYCNRNNLFIKKIYREVVSGENLENRPQAQLLLEEVASGLYDGVVVVEIERLSRGNPIDQVEILETFKSSKSKIYTLQKVFDFSCDNDIDEEYFEFGLFMSRREYKTIIRRLVRGKKQAQQEGYFIGSQLPYGYGKIREGKGYVLVPNEQAEVVKIIFNKYVYEGLNISDIHDYLYQNKIKSASGNDSWSVGYLRKLIKNKTYIGYICVNTRHNRDNANWIKGKHKPIIDSETFEKAQEKRKLLDPKINKGKTIKNPLASLVFCGKCGYTMHRYSKRGNDLLCCRNRLCNNSGTYLELIEKEIIKELKQELIGFNYFLENFTQEIEKKKINKQKELELLNKEILKKETMITRCCEFLEEGIYTKEKYHSRVSVLEKDLEDLKIQLNEIKENDTTEVENNIRSSIPILEKIMDEYWNLNFEERNAVLKSIITKIDYIKEKPNEAWATKKNIANKFELKIFMKI